jgi:VanZ family protein
LAPAEAADRCGTIFVDAAFMWSFCFRIAGWLAVAAIVVLSLLPGQDRPHSGAPGEFEHLVAYLVAAVVLGIGYPERKTQVKLAVFLMLLSGLMEICQLWIPGRNSELAGFLGSSARAIIGMILATMSSVAHHASDPKQ